MIEEIKVEGMDALKSALENMKTKIDSGGLPEITSSDNGKALKASYSEGEGSASWEDLSEVPEVTSSDNNKVLKAHYSEGAGSYEWGGIDTGSNYDFANDNNTMIGSFDYTSGQSVVAHPIVTREVDVSGTIYPGNGNFSLDLPTIPNNAIILDATIYGTASGNIVCIKPTYAIHNPETLPANTSWNFFVGSLSAFESVSISKAFIVYVDMTSV